MKIKKHLRINSIELFTITHSHNKILPITRIEIIHTKNSNFYSSVQKSLKLQITINSVFKDNQFQNGVASIAYRTCNYNLNE